MTFLSNKEIMDPTTTKDTMTNKLGYADISTQLNKFISTTVVHFDSHSYAAGALQAQLAFVLAELPAHKQQETLHVFVELAAKYSAK